MNYPDSGYERDYCIEGDRLVVDDIYRSELYADDVGLDERYEVRFHGLRLGRFKSLQGVDEFLEGEFDVL